MLRFELRIFHNIRLLRGTTKIQENNELSLTAVEDHRESHNKRPSSFIRIALIARASSMTTRTAAAAARYRRMRPKHVTFVGIVHLYH